MVKRYFFIVALLVAGFLAGAFFFRIQGADRRAAAPQAAPRVSERFLKTGGDFSEIVESVSPAVVNIATVKSQRREPINREDPFYDYFNDFLTPFNDLGLERDYLQQDLGSGLIVSGDGYIITNNHVVSGAERINVTLYDKRVFRGDIVGSDPKTDLAVVKIPSKDLPVAAWGDSDRLQVGEFVLAIGNPYGLNHTVTMGIISAVGRADVGVADYEDFIQTDAAINPGNSGGPLVDAEGNLVGINTAIFSRSGGYQGIGFAVPSNMVRLVMEQLVKQGRVIRGWLGVTIQELTPELSGEFGYRSTEGALVGEVLGESPAEGAGMKRGDIIVEFDGKKVAGPATLKNLVAASRPGTKAPVKIFRGNKTFRYLITVGELPQEGARPSQRKAEREKRGLFSGMGVVTLTEDIAGQLGLGGGERGVVVVSVQEGSPAQEAGLKRGDVVLEIDGARTADIKDFQRASSRKGADGSALLYVNRSGRKFYVALLAS